MHNQKPNVHNKMKYPQTQNSHCLQCADKENTNVVQRGVKNITKTSQRHHGTGGGAEGPEAGGSGRLSKMARNISWISSLS
jgi:hypothetical protein